MKYFFLDKKSWDYSKPSLVVFLVTTLYLIYLSLIAQAIMVNDSIGYEALGERMYHGGLSGYLRDGLTREPLYPFLISVAMRLSDAMGIEYYQIQKWIQISLLMGAQITAFMLLKSMRIRRWIVAMVVLSLGAIPTLINSTMWTYSEVITYPLMIVLVLLCTQLLIDLKEQNSFDIRVAAKAVALGFCCVMLTMVKAAFELIVPIIFCVFILVVVAQGAHKKHKRFLLGLIFVFITITAYYAPVTWYKWFNWKQNGYFSLTNRVQGALYGLVERRMEPLNIPNFIIMVAYIPGPEFCSKVFNDEKCYAWSPMIADRIAMDYVSKKQGEFANGQQMGHHLIQMSGRIIMENPIKFIVLTYLESLRALFWANDYDSQVAYPEWLTRIYRHKDIFMGVTFVLASITLLAYIHCLQGAVKTVKDIFRNNVVSLAQISYFSIFIIVSVFIASYAIFQISPRNALPVVPLYLVMIAVWAESLLRNVNKTVDNEI